MSACGSGSDPRVGTLAFTANGEDFVRQGWLSEDDWWIDLSRVRVNVLSPTAYQVVEEYQALPALRHGGHPHEDIPEGSAHVALPGEFWLDLKQETFELGRTDSAPIGNYNRLAFGIAPASSGSAGDSEGYQGASIVMEGLASRDGQPDVAFALRFTQEISYTDCGPNAYEGVLAEGGLAHSEMTFHFDHLFGDAGEGPADPEDPDTVNALAIGFSPLASLAQDGQLDMDQAALAQALEQDTYEQLLVAVDTLGHSGEGHCHLVEETEGD